jgi:hypothetical protein
VGAILAKSPKPNGSLKSRLRAIFLILLKSRDLMPTYSLRLRGIICLLLLKYRVKPQGTTWWASSY